MQANCQVHTRLSNTVRNMVQSKEFLIKLVKTALEVGADGLLFHLVSKFIQTVADDIQAGFCVVRNEPHFQR
jgi:hypothetical protein